VYNSLVLFSDSKLEAYFTVSEIIKEEGPYYKGTRERRDIRSTSWGSNPKGVAT
jgi:hypothetical protein